MHKHQLPLQPRDINDYLLLKDDNPLLIVLVHFKNVWEAPRHGLLSFRTDGMTEWLDHHFHGLETVLEPFHALRKLHPFYYIYVAPSGGTSGKWHELNFTPGSKATYDWEYEGDRVFIPVSPSEFTLGGQ
jgi:hypothetical protein